MCAFVRRGIVFKRRKTDKIGKVKDKDLCYNDFAHLVKASGNAGYILLGGKGSITIPKRYIGKRVILRVEVVEVDKGGKIKSE